MEKISNIVGEMSVITIALVDVLLIFKFNYGNISTLFTLKDKNSFH